MDQKLILLTFFLIFVSISVASHNVTSENNERTLNFNSNNGGEIRDPNVETMRSDIMSRSRRKKLFYGLGGLWLGGFHALAALVAIKFKIIVIGIFVFGAIFYGIRIWAGKGIGCPEPSIVKEPFYPHGITAYSPHTSSDIYSSYPGISSSSGVYLSHPPSGADVYPSTGYSSYPGAISGDVPAEVLAESHYKRKGRSLEGEGNEARGSSNGIDVAEIMFGFLNVRTLDCKRRFVCEVDFISKRDPWIRMGYNLMGEGLFKKYRTNDSVNVKKYRECLKLFESCKTPHEEEAHKVGYVETTSTNSTKKASLRRRNRRKQITNSFFF